MQAELSKHFINDKEQLLPFLMLYFIFLCVSSALNLFALCFSIFLWVAPFLKFIWWSLIFSFTFLVDATSCFSFSMSLIRCERCFWTQCCCCSLVIVACWDFSQVEKGVTFVGFLGLMGKRRNFSGFWGSVFGF